MAKELGQKIGDKVFFFLPRASIVDKETESSDRAMRHGVTFYSVKKGVFAGYHQDICSISEKEFYGDVLHKVSKDFVFKTEEEAEEACERKNQENNDLLLRVVGLLVTKVDGLEKEISNFRLNLRKI